MIDDDGQVALTLAMRYLVDADSPQPVEQVGVAGRLLTDAFADTADRPPRDPHQLGDCGLRRIHRQPRRLVLERSREPRAVPGPRDRTDHDATRGAAASTNASVVPRFSARHRRGSPGGE